MMPATQSASRTLATARAVVTALRPAAAPAVPVPLRAPLFRTDDATVLPTPCMVCGLNVEAWGWINYDGRGVLMHDVDAEVVPCPMARPFDWATGDDLEPTTAEGLSCIEWIVALYCSPYVPKSRPAPGELARLITSGLDRVGYERIAHLAAQLQWFWQHCEHNTDTKTVWDTHTGRFDYHRAMQASYEVERNFRPLLQLLRTVEEVAA